MADHYVPQRGDVVWIDFDPQQGCEQAGRRPGVVLTASSYNATVGLALLCPVTKQKKGYPFEVELVGCGDVKGVVLVDHIKSFDWRKRRADKFGRISEDIMQDIFAKLETLLYDKE